MKSNPNPPIYSQVAFDIAKKIAAGEMKEGYRFTGRSLMSTQYNVSSETIRRAMSLLSEMGIITIQANVGAEVISREYAQTYIEKFDTGKSVRGLKQELEELTRERDGLNEKIAQVMEQILDLHSRFRRSDAMDNYEFEILPESSICHKSVGESNFRRRTGATITAVRRGTEILLAPGADFLLKEFDVLLVVAPPEAVEKVTALLEK